MVREYADTRDADDSPYRWRKYLASQERYLRFCCFTVAGELMEQQQDMPMVAELPEPEEIR
jgi:hypothetical protein